MSEPQHKPIQLTITFADAERLLATDVLLRCRAQVRGLRDSHGVECGAEAIEQVAAELGIQLSPIELED